MELTNIKPALMAFLICNHIQSDTPQSNKSLIGLFDSINTPSFPCTGNFNIFIKLLGGLGEQKIRLMVQGPSTKAVMDPFEITFTMPSISKFLDIVLEMNNKIVFHESGIHKVRLYQGDNLIAEHPLIVKKTNG